MFKLKSNAAFATMKSAHNSSGMPFVVDDWFTHLSACLNVLQEGFTMRQSKFNTVAFIWPGDRNQVSVDQIFILFLINACIAWVECQRIQVS